MMTSRETDLIEVRRVECSGRTLTAPQTGNDFGSQQGSLSNPQKPGPRVPALGRYLPQGRAIGLEPADIAIGHDQLVPGSAP
jgi:hypothetical protein